MDNDGTAALIVSTLTSMTLPTISSMPKSDQALVELERWLGTAGQARN
jgi:hypothetical protein